MALCPYLAGVTVVVGGVAQHRAVDERPREEVGGPARHLRNSQHPQHMRDQRAVAVLRLARVVCKPTIHLP